MSSEICAGLTNCTACVADGCCWNPSHPSRNCYFNTCRNASTSCESNELSTLAIIGIIIGCIVFLCCIVAFCWWSHKYTQRVRAWAREEEQKALEQHRQQPQSMIVMQQPQQQQRVIYKPVQQQMTQMNASQPVYQMINGQLVQVNPN